MNSLLRRGLRRIRRAFWLTRAERGHQRWQADRGDRGHRFDYPLAAGAIVVDAGGFDGRWAEKALATFNATVHVFEPVPEFAAQIENRLRGGHAYVHVYGLAGRTREAEFTVAGDSSSALRGAGARTRVLLRDVVEVFGEMRFERVDLMKVNIEGGEYELLEAMLDAGLAARVGYFQIQFHDFVPHAHRRMCAIQRRLRLTHDLEWEYEFVWESWRNREGVGPPHGRGIR
jgi:FkbM family methyltransferase